MLSIVHCRVLGLDVRNPVFKALIRMLGCAGWYVSLLFSSNTIRVSCEKADLTVYLRAGNFVVC